MPTSRRHYSARAPKPLKAEQGSLPQIPNMGATRTGVRTIKRAKEKFYRGEVKRIMREAELAGLQEGK